MKKAYGFRMFKGLQIALYHELGLVPKLEYSTDFTDEPKKRLNK
jgi:hypothetical protein